MADHALIKDTKERMDKAVGHTRDMLKNIRTSRASAALVDHIRVEYYGTPTPLPQMAQISVPEPRQLLIKPFDMSAVKEIERAIQKSDLGITPESDGKVIRLTMPPLSGEQRKKYAAKAKDMTEEGRIALRNIRRDLNKEADALQKSGGCTEDEHKKLVDDIQKTLKDYESKLNEIQERKHKEIMEE